MANLYYVTYQKHQLPEQNACVKLCHNPLCSVRRSKLPINWNECILKNNVERKTVKKDNKQNVKGMSKGEQRNKMPEVAEVEFHTGISSVVNVKILELHVFCSVFCCSLAPLETTLKTSKRPLIKKQIYDSKLYETGKKISMAVAIDCEMVVGEYNSNILARVSLVDENDECIYDTFVRANERIIDYLTDISGVRKEDMQHGKDFKIVQREVYELIKGKILVGHSIHNDLKALRLSHPRKYTRDTSKYRPFKDMNNGRTPALKTLAKLILGWNIQDGEHSSVEDARATINIYLRYRDQWEQELRDQYDIHK